MAPGPLRLVAATVLGFCIGLFSFASARAEPLIVDVRLNGVRLEEVVSLSRNGAEIEATPEALKAIGLAFDASAIDQVRGTVRLNSLPGVRANLEAATQTLDLQAAPDRLASNRLSAPHPDVPLPDTSAWGALLNYNFYGLASRGAAPLASLVTETRVFGPLGLLSNSLELTRGSRPGANLRRLETSYVHDDYATARRLVVGDFVSAGPGWATPFRAGGVSFSTDFSLRPDMVTQPIPRITGAAAVPSTVDLYVDGVRRFTTRAPAGPFVVDAPPTVNGRGVLTTVITDVLGRQTVQALEFYGANQLLAPGVTGFAADAGALRLNYSAVDDHYGKGFATFAVRRGLTKDLTLDLQASATKSAGSVGLGVAGKLRESALFEAAFRVSDRSGARGEQVYATVHRETDGYAAFATLKLSSRDYWELGQPSGLAGARSEASVGASVRNVAGGSLGANFSELKWDRQRYRALGANWSRNVGPAYVFINGFTSFDKARATAVSIGFTASFGAGRPSVAAGATTRDGNVRLQASVAQTSQEAEGWSWRLSGESQPGSQGASRLEGEARRSTRVGEFGLGLSEAQGRSAGQVYGSGSLVLIGGRLRAAAHIGDAFALIETGAPNIGVAIENRTAGRTDPNGSLLVTQINSRAATRVAIEAETVSLDEAIAVQERFVRPPRGGAAIVRLPVHKGRSAVVRLVARDGRPIPPGLSVRLNDLDAGVTGFDGEAFLTGLEAMNRLEIFDQSGSCRLEMPYVPPPSGVAKIGPLVCDIPGPGDPLDRSLRIAVTGASSP